MSWNPVNDAWDKVKGWLEDRVKHAKQDINRVVDQAEHAAHEAEREVNSVIKQAKNAEKSLERRVKQAEDEVERTLKKLPHEIEELSHQVIDQIKHDIGALLKHEIEDRIVGWLEHALPAATKQRILIFDFHVNIREKVEELRHYLHNPPRTRQEIVDMLATLTDDDVIEVHPLRIPALPYLGIDPAIPIHVDTLIKNADKLLHKLD